jgi:predicted RecA/RadA family phage recombinase
MKNYLQPGKTVEVAAPANVASGDFILVGTFGGVCQLAAPSGALVPIVREGVFTLPKAAGQVWAQGVQLYWDAVAKNFTTTSAGNTKWGGAFAAAASPDATGQVSFTPIG